MFISRKTTSSVISLRLDSDDVINRHYLTIISQILNIGALSDVNDATFCYVHGLQNREDLQNISPKIWGESPFLLRYEKFTEYPMKTIWENSHDKQDLSSNFFNIITDTPMWCIQLGKQNLANTFNQYLYAREENISSITNAFSLF